MFISHCAIALLFAFSVDFEVWASSQFKQTLELEGFAVSCKSAVQGLPLAQWLREGGSCSLMHISS